MRKLLIIAICVLLYSCKTSYINKELKGNLFDRFPKDFWDNDNEKYEEGIQYLAYIYKGIEFYPARVGYIYIYISSIYILKKNNFIPFIMNIIKALLI